MGSEDGLRRERTTSWLEIATVGDGVAIVRLLEDLRDERLALCSMLLDVLLRDGVRLLVVDLGLGTPIGTPLRDYLQTLNRDVRAVGGTMVLEGGRHRLEDLRSEFTRPVGGLAVTDPVRPPEDRTCDGRHASRGDQPTDGRDDPASR